MNVLEVFFWYLLPLVVNLTNYITMRRALKKYDARPAYSPPGWVFTIVWFALYMLQGTAAWLLMRDNADRWSFELTMICVYWGLSILYGPIFSRRNNQLTFFYTFVLFAYSSVIVGFFFKKYAWSGWIILPTAIWLAFGSWLSFSTYQNRRYATSPSRRNRRRSDEIEEEAWVSPTTRESSSSDDELADPASFAIFAGQPGVFSRMLRKGN